MTGMDATTGAPLAGEAHLRQSIRDILTTPIGSRIGRRDYGSEIVGLIDAPVTPSTMLRLFAATAMALLRWEPRLRLTRVAIVAGDTPGAFVLTLDGQRLDLLPSVPARLTVAIATSAAA